MFEISFIVNNNQNDGSYFNDGVADVGYRAYYVSADHSAITTFVTPSDNTMTSKWGSIGLYSRIRVVLPAEYTCVKITDEFFDNGIDIQGAALRIRYKTNEDFHADVKEDAYAIFVKQLAVGETFPDYKNDTCVFYYINGEYMVVDMASTILFELEKMK